MQSTLRGLARARQMLLTPSDMDAVFRQLLRRMAVEGRAPLEDAHAAFLQRKYGIRSGSIRGDDLLRTWRPAVLAHVELDDRMPRVPNLAHLADLDAFFVPSLDWEQRIGGGALRIMLPMTCGEQTAEAAALERRVAGRRYLTLGDQFSLTQARPGRGYASMRILRSRGSGHGVDEVIEMPLHVSRPMASSAWAVAAGAAGATGAASPALSSASPAWVGLCEGVLKSMSAAQAFGVPVLGEWSCGGGQFYRSPTQLRAYLQLAASEQQGVPASDAVPPPSSSSAAGPRPSPVVVLLADAGSQSNPVVALHYCKTLKLLEDWGYEARVGWWGQEAKADEGGPGDVDEMLLSHGAGTNEGGGARRVLAESVMRWITRAEFEELLSPEAEARVERWRSETGFVSMAESVDWELLRLP